MVDLSKLVGLGIFCTNGHDLKKEGLYQRGKYFICKRCVKEGVEAWRATPRGRKRANKAAKDYYWRNRKTVLRKAKAKREATLNGSRTTTKRACG